MARFFGTQTKVWISSIISAVSSMLSTVEDEVSEASALCVSILSLNFSKSIVPPKVSREAKAFPPLCLYNITTFRKGVKRLYISLTLYCLILMCLSYALFFSVESLSSSPERLRVLKARFSTL